MDVRKLSVKETSFLHLNNASDEPLYEDGEDGKPDENKKVGITLWSPGTKQYSKAIAAKNNRTMMRMKRKGHSELSAEDAIKEGAQFLADVTKEFHYIERDGLEGEALFKAVYSDTSVGFIAEQAQKQLGDWANFT